MIYPAKKKIRKFSGGGFASLFDNPGTYLGIQYVPKTQVLPDVEGLQYLMQMDQAKIESQQKASAAAKTVKNDSFKNFSDVIKGFDALTKQGQSVIGGIDENIQGWYERFPTVEAMNSSEANADMVRILNDASKSTLRAKNDKELYGKKYDDAKGKDVLSNYYYNNGTLALQDLNDPSKVKHVSDEDYFSKKDSDYKDFRPMRISEIFGWMNDHSENPLQSGFDVNQISYDKRQENIDKFFKSFATDSTSISGGNLLKEELKKVGIENPQEIDVAEFKIKMQSGEMNAGLLLDIFSKNMDPQVYNSIRSEMIEKGQNPNEIVGTSTDKDGKEIEITAFQNKVFELFTGEKIKKLGSISEVSLMTVEEKEKAAKIEAEAKVASEGAFGSKLNGLKSRADDIVQWSINNKLPLPTPAYVWNPYSGKTELGLSQTLTDMDDNELEAILGHERGFREIRGGVKKVIAGGYEVQLKEGPQSKDSNSGRRYWESPDIVGVRTYDVNDPNSENNLVALSSLDTYILTNKSGLSSFTHPSNSKRLGKDDFVTEASFGTSGFITRLSRSDFENKAATYNKEAQAKGLELINAAWWIEERFGSEDFIYEVRVEIPINNLTGANGIAPSKANSEYLLQNEDYAAQIRQQNDARNEEAKAQLAAEQLEKSKAQLEGHAK